LAEYASKYLSNVKVCDVQGSHWQIPRYDFVLCANVLSAIPNKRIRINILRLVYPLIKRKGKLFVCTQYRNSYFNAYADNPNARKYLDGWLISNSHGESFYGIIPPEELKSICVKAGYDIVECYSKGESAYILANT
jgi:2-polyprenyl-3-methyl-5-hydroxy-6-metoxy-1,4-benzoquinol methylase